MAQGRDEDALSWDTGDDPTLDVGSAAPAQAPDEAKPAEPEQSEPAPADNVEPASADNVEPAPAEPALEEHAEHDHLSNAALVTIGILGGFYLLFTVGWLIGGFRLQGRAQYLVADVMFQGSFWLAVLAPALWFGTVLLLTRRSRTWVRITWLVAGAVLLIPWPFIMVGAVGQ